MIRAKTMLGAALFLASGGCIATSFPKTPAHGGPAWSELTTEHFFIDTDLDPAEAIGVARQMENLRKIMAEAVFGGEPPPGPRGRVLVLRRDEYSHFDRVNAGAFISSVLFQPMLVTSPGGDWSTFEADVRKHELAHYVSSLYIDMRLQPRWFAEGVADYLETLRYDEKTGAVEIGHHPPDYQYLEYAHQASFDELWAWDKAKPYDALTARLYQTSWAAVHYLFDRRAADLLDYERALARGDDAQKSWKGLFPDLTGSDMDDVVRKYIHKRDYQIVKATVPPVAVSPDVRTLSEADVLAFRAALYMAFQSVSNRTADETKKLATESVTASLGVDEGSFWAHLVNMFYFDSVTATPDIGRRATVDHANNWLAWLFYADVQRRAKAPLDEQRSALAKALELAPRNGIALTQLSFVEARAGKWKAALAAANQAVASPPVANDSVLALAIALSHSGHCSEARSVEEVLQKRLPKEVPKDFAAALAENREACASERADTAKR